MTRRAAHIWFAAAVALLVEFLLLFLPVPEVAMAGIAGMSVAVNFVLLLMLIRLRSRRVAPTSPVTSDDVRTAFNALAAGIVVIDRHERITLANTTFAEFVGVDSGELVQTKLSDLPWHCDSDEDGQPEKLPWITTLHDGTQVASVIVHLRREGHPQITFSVNCSVLGDKENRQHTVLVCFEDVTALEKEKEELDEAISVVELWRAEMRKHSEQLQRMATEDSLTGCLNRRAFFETIDYEWQVAARDDSQLSCLMLDIDYFKQINDQHGHAMVDLVLEKNADAIRMATAEGASICRYGGEEFCVLLPQYDIDQAANQANRIRAAVDALLLGELHVTVSIGVSSRAFGAETPQGMIEQADRSLYAAKNNGRNQVIRWDAMPDPSEQLMANQEGHNGTARTSKDMTLDVEVPYHAVSALLAALEYRDRETAEHCRRVADLCVLIASDTLPVRECYILETAALLHDIGKIGIPDSILHKPASLTREEWKTMATHVRLGIEIVATTFSCPLLINIIKHHHTWVAGQYGDAEQNDEHRIPWGAKVLAVAEAYDAMRTETAYRKPLSQEEAIAELRRCSGTQFDPDVVERLIEILEKQRHRTTPLGPVPAPGDIVLSGRDLSQLTSIY